MRKKLIRSLVLTGFVGSMILPGVAQAQSTADTDFAYVQFNQNTRTLFVHGTDDDDTFSIEPSGNAIYVNLNSRLLDDTGCEEGSNPSQVRCAVASPTDEPVNAVIDLGAGNDSFVHYFVALDAAVYGGPGNDVYSNRDAHSSGSSVSYFGGEGSDTANYYYAAPPTGFEGVDISFDNQANDGAEGDSDNIRSDVEKVIGTPRDDRIYGNDNRNVIYGRGGYDVIYGLGGHDYVNVKVLEEDEDDPTVDVPAFIVDCGDGTDTLTGRVSYIRRSCERIFF